MSKSLHPRRAFQRSPHLHFASSLCAAVGIVGFLAMWEVAAWITASPLLPAFSGVVGALFVNIAGPELWLHAFRSFARFCGGLAIAATVSLVAGILMSEFALFRRIFLPLVDVFRSIAALAIYPAIILFVGLGEASKIFLVFWAAWPPILLNVILGISLVDMDIKRSAQMCGANRYVLLFQFSLPLSLPAILTGVRIAAGVGWISLVASEMIAGSSGIGYYVLFNSQIFEYESMYVGVIVIAAVGGLTHVGLGTIQRLVNMGIN